jgi:hypothetical protein
MIPDHQQAPKAVIEEVGDKIAHSSEFANIITTKPVEPQARGTQVEFEQTMIKAIEETPPEPEKITPVEEEIKINFDEPSISTSKVQQVQIEVKSSQVSFENTLKFEEPIEVPSSTQINEKKSIEEIKPVDIKTATKSAETATINMQTSFKKIVAHELANKKITQTATTASGNYAKLKRTLPAKIPALKFAHQETVRHIKSVKIATGNLNKSLSPELIGIVKKKVEPVKPVKVILPELSKDAQSLQTKGITLILNEQTSVQSLKNQNQSLIAMNSTLDGFRLSIPSNRCEGITFQGGIGVETTKGFVAKVNVVIPGDFNSKDCKKSLDSIAKSIDSQCDAITKWSRIQTLPATWALQTSHACARKET